MTNGKLILLGRAAPDLSLIGWSGFASLAVWLDWIERGLGLVVLVLTIAVLIYRLRKLRGGGE